MDQKHRAITEEEALARIESRKAPLKFVRNLILNLRIFPKTPDFFAYFEKSSENTVSGTRLLCQMVRQKDERHSLLELLKEYEHIGDHITHDVIDLLHHTFLTPFDRMDIHTLIVKMDDILDITYYVGNRMTRYGVVEMTDELGQLADIVYKASVELSKAIPYLRHLKNSSKILRHCVEINRLENEADDIINVVMEKLFRDDYDPYQLIKVKELAENLETAADKCEDVANLLEGIILRNA